MPLMTQTPGDFDLGQIWNTAAGLSPVLTSVGTLQFGNDYMFPCYDRSTVRPWKLRSAMFMTARLVINNSGGVLTAPAKNMLAINPADPTSVTGLASSTTLQAFPCDEWVVGNIPAGAAFWVITGGLTKVIYAATVTADVTAGDWLNPSAVTNGAVDIINTFTANKTLFNNIKNAHLMATVTITAVNAAATSALVQVI